ncbi:MAG: rhodanese-related sulfurtransferase [Buchnera aphidicola (Meitanaphis elongallis)]
MIMLHNLMINKELKDRMLADNTPRITVSFYKYFVINDIQKFRNDWYSYFKNLNVFGRIYVAKEGINAQISIPNNVYSDVKKFIYTYSNVLKKIHVNRSLDTRKSFWMLCIKIKETILADHLCEKSYNLNYTGKYLNAIQVNKMINKKDVTFLDIRNHYEYKIGRFKNAINVPVNTFRIQLQEIISFLKDKKNKKIVIYCTGGIRCEKASSWMIYNGFKYIYQVKGGIIGYVNNAKRHHLPIQFLGKNFVFDARMSEIVSNDILSTCSQCNCACDTYKNCYNHSCHKLFIQCIKCSKKFKDCCSQNCISIRYFK